MIQAKAISSKTKTKSTSKAQLMQLLKFKVLEWESAQDLLDEQMQQTEAAADLQELVDELRLRKAELDHIYNGLIEQPLTQEEFDTVAAESARINCKWLRTTQKIRLLHGSNHKKTSLPTPPRKNPTNYGARFLFQKPDENNQAEWDVKRQCKMQVKTHRAGMRYSVLMTMMVYRPKPSSWSSKRASGAK